MKRIFLLALLFPLLGVGQNKNVVSVDRVFPKVDKVLEFEKALAVHAQKYHMGDWKWRVFYIQSGPDAGGYHITEGPTSWEAIDGRGNLGTEHNNDWNKSVAIYLTERSSTSFSVYQDSLSTVALTDYSDKINVTHWYPKIGYGGKINDLLKLMKNVWVAGGESNAIYIASSSGPAQYSIVTRYKQGLKERAAGFRKPFKERYEAANGPNSFDNYLTVIREYLDKSWSELLSFRADLSSK